MRKSDIIDVITSAKPADAKPVAGKLTSLQRDAFEALKMAADETKIGGAPITGVIAALSALTFAVIDVADAVRERGQS